MSKADFTVVVLGRHTSGKTSLVERFLKDRYREEIPATVGAAFGAKKITVDEKAYVLGIWDTAGTERFESMTRNYYRSAKAAIVVHDLADGDSWKRATFWVEELKNAEPGCAIYLVGTKADLIFSKGLQQAPSSKVVKAYADEQNAKTFITSAKHGDGVNELFQTITANIVAQAQALQNSKTNPLRGSSARALTLEESLEHIPENDMVPAEPKNTCACWS
eukprot:TRINITY_DN18334_c0_g1_i1.p1 TRINITY_DN18334_c0_g1~~TRINITY_DN18334_c0_g1_i1.p1  ORF type:complete len:220 (-),score=45.44 TRINITY_DN18334_c0_g1_i1:33-692(-)